MIGFPSLFAALSTEWVSRATAQQGQSSLANAFWQRGRGNKKAPGSFAWQQNFREL
ncbi:hypothetical protein [Mesorhizobium sp. B2-6-2]|uniref:hypothetical protein n=1 Tax=Mesorhizobium sp. B2-6-2 TaxID=2589915 RepID=UPI0015E2A93E|nr:hypothetical protein [Mesorhizobium sp. B2-6-2]